MYFSVGNNYSSIMDILGIKKGYKYVNKRIRKELNISLSSLFASMKI